MHIDMHTRRRIFIALPCLAMTTALLSGVSLAQSQVPTDLARWIPGFRLAGEGRLRMFGFHIYDAQLFVGQQGMRNKELFQIGPHPFALNLRYARAFRGQDIAKRTRQEMEKLGQSKPSEQQTWETQLASFLPDVVAGTELTGVYLPGRGTLFLSRGKVLGEIAGVNFARAFFGIWLDPQTSSPEVRLALLKSAAAQTAP